MVFNDYELIATGRVANNRRHTAIYRGRLFEAFGGYSTAYSLGLFTMGGAAFGLQSVPAMTMPVLSASGL